MTWNRTSTGYRCDRHDETFGATATCPKCALDAGPAPDQEGDEPLPPPPPGCMSTAEIEALLVSCAAELDEWIKIAADEARGYDYHRANTVVKFYDTRLKFLNRAGEYARPREDEVRLKRREKLAAEMARGAGR